MVKALIYIRFNGNTYKPGELVSGLSDADEERLISSEYAERIENHKQKSTEYEPITLEEISETDDIESLEYAWKEELAGKSRKEILKAIKSRIAILNKKPEDKQEVKKEVKQDNLKEKDQGVHINFNAEDVIVE